jgi:large subunit ribosomal protein L24
MNKLKQGDTVIVTTGKDKSKQGAILRIDNGKAVVEGINIAKKHQKPNPSMGVAGGIVEIEMPIQLSNIMLFNPVTKKGDRVGIKVLEDGRKVRYFKSNNEVVES